VAVAAGRSRFRVVDLLGLAELIERAGHAIRRDSTNL